MRRLQSKFRMSWLSGSLVVLALFVAFGLGYSAHRFEWIPLPLRQQVLRALEPEKAPIGWSFTDDVRASTDGGIGSLGYVSGYEPASELSSVTFHAEDQSFAGVNLYVSGHASEAILMDMAGFELHRWEHDFHDEWPDAEVCPMFGPSGMGFWRRAHLFDNGDLLATYAGYGLVKLDVNSDVLWTAYSSYHHDLHVADDGRIYVLDRDVHENGRWDYTVEDFVVVLSEDGKVLERVSIVECFDRSRYHGMLDRMPREGEQLHANTIQWLDGSLEAVVPAFQKGRVLISARDVNVAAVLDLQRREVVWALGGQWLRQHQPELLAGEDGLSLLVFDNLGNRGKSQILEVDPLTQALRWSYQGTAARPLDSHVLGSCSRLPNGNTLISESTQGRALEVNPEGEIVWEFYNPHRAGSEGELMANLFEVVRLGSDFPLDWIPRKLAGGSSYSPPPTPRPGVQGTPARSN